MVSEVLSHNRLIAYSPLSSCESGGDRGLRNGHQSWSSGVVCRPNCYKVLIGIVLVFLLMQFTANFVAYKHKMTVSQSLALSSILSNQWSSVSSPPSVVSHHIISRLVNPTVKQLLNNKSNEDLLTKSVIINSSLNNDIKRTINTINQNSGTIFAVNSSQQTTDPIINFLNESLTTSTSSLEICPLIPPKLVGRLKVLTESPPFDKLEELLPELEPGGRFKPKNCLARSKVAIVIPYRDREEHLRTFLYNIHPMLERQQLDYGIYIVEESGNGKFNRAKLMNIGFLEALKQYDYECFIFHDVDLIPEDDRNLYTCPEQPRHMSVAIDKFSYRLPYKDLFGGVSALTTEQFKRINGFSNEFWGWGGEDDDMSNRVRYYGYKISRYSANIARYKMLKHKGDTPNPDRYKKLYSGKRRYKTDGINNVKYKLVDLVFKKTYTWILVDLGSP